MPLMNIYQREAAIRAVASRCASLSWAHAIGPSGLRRENEQRCRIDATINKIIKIIFTAKCNVSDVAFLFSSS